jgi:hypothetical protein
MKRSAGGGGEQAAVAVFVPLPVMPVVTGLQIELLRGAMLVGLGMLAIRSIHPVAAATPEPALVV